MSPPRPRTRSTARSAQDRGAPQDGGPAQEGRAGKAPSRPGTSSDELRELLEPFVTDAGFELDALDVRSAGRRHTVRMVVDSDSGAGLDAIARLSRAASDALDADPSAALAACPSAPGDGPPAARLEAGRRGLRGAGRCGGRHVRDAAGRRAAA